MTLHYGELWECKFCGQTFPWTKPTLYFGTSTILYDHLKDNHKPGFVAGFQFDAFRVVEVEMDDPYYEVKVKIIIYAALANFFIWWYVFGTLLG